MSNKKIYIIAGEASGDLHGAKLITNLLSLNPCIHIRAWGGDKMQASGAEIVKHYKDLAFMGFWEVAKNINTIIANLHWCKNDILSFDPDLIIFIDYPGFNLRIAKWAKKQKINAVYYIAPQIWAWNEKRVHSLCDLVNQVYTILPFEKDFFKDYGYDVKYIGHPLFEAILSAPKRSISTEKNSILLLPGSRQQEIAKILPIFAKTAELFQNSYSFTVAGLGSIGINYYKKILIKYPFIEVKIDETYQLMKESKLAWVSSGTASLELAFYKVPHIVCYSGNWISYTIAKSLIQIPFISLVNLIPSYEIIPELIQDQFTKENLCSNTFLLEMNYQSMIKNFETKLFPHFRNTLNQTDAARDIANNHL